MSEQVLSNKQPLGQTLSLHKGKSRSRTALSKSPEDMYEEILELKKSLASISEENSGLKAKLRRQEDDSSKKERQIQQLILENKKSDAAHKAMMNEHRKPSTSISVTMLKQRIQQLEKMVIEKDTGISKSNVKSSGGISENTATNGVILPPASKASSRSAPPQRDSVAKMRSLQESHDATRAASQKLEEENTALKQDLLRALAVTNGPVKVDYEQHSKTALVSMVSRLENVSNF